MLHLEEKGWAPGPLSEVTRIGTRKEGKIEPGRVMDSMEGHLQKTEELLVNAMNNKLGKNYHQSTRLLVTFEDFIIRKEPDVTQRLMRVIDKVLIDKECRFDQIYLVGMSEKLLLHYAVGS